MVWLNRAAVVLLIGSGIFQLLAISACTLKVARCLGAVTPIGGVLILVGWAIISFAIQFGRYNRAYVGHLNSKKNLAAAIAGTNSLLDEGQLEESHVRFNYWDAIHSMNGGLRLHRRPFFSKQFVMLLKNSCESIFHQFC